MLGSETWVLTTAGPRRLRDLLGETAALITPDGTAVDVAVGEPAARRSVEGVTVELNGGVSMTASIAARLPDGPVSAAREQPKRQYRSGRDVLPETERRGRRSRPPRLASTSTPVGAIRDALASARTAPTVGLYLPGIRTWPGRGDSDDGYLVGHFIGDGNFTTSSAVIDVWNTGDGINAVRARLHAAAARLPARSDWQGFSDVRGRDEARMSSAGLLEHVTSWDLYPKFKTLNDTILKGSGAFAGGVIAGLMDTDGHVEGNSDKSVSIRLSQAERELLEKAQLLLGFFGIRSRIYAGRPPGRRMMPDGHGGNSEFETQGFHRLTVSGLDAANLMQVAPFVDTDKIEKFEALTAGMVFYRKAHAAQVTAVRPAPDAELVPLAPVCPEELPTPWIGANGAVVDLTSLAPPRGAHRRAARRSSTRDAVSAGHSPTAPSAADPTDRILGLRAEGRKVSEISLLLRLPPSTVREALAAAGQPERARGRAAHRLAGVDLRVAYEKGASVGELATQHGVSETIIREALLVSGATLRGQGVVARTMRLRAAKTDELRAQYARSGLRAMATSYGVSTSRLRMELLARGIQTRASGRRPPR